MLEHLGLGIVLTMQDDFTPQANKAMQSMDMFENQVDVMTKNVSRAMNNLQNLMLAGFSLNTMGGDFIRGGQKILGFYKDMAGEMININSQFDSIGATFKTVYGDLATEKLDWAMDFSIKTPFQVKDTTRAMSGLHAIGLDVTQQIKSATGEMVPLLQAMGDLSTRNTGARGGISGMMEAVSNLYGGDGGRSLRARFDLPKTYVDELKDAVDEGGEVFAQKFADLANKLTPNAMVNMLGTWEQVVAEMEDTWDMFIWKVGKAGAFDTAKQTLKDIAGALGNLASNEQAIQSISNVFQAIWKPVDLIAKGLIRATEAISNFVVKHPKLAEFIGTGVAIGGAMMVATGAIMKMAGSVVVLGASIASLYLNFKLVKGLNLVGEFDFIFKAVSRGVKSFTTWGLVLGGFALAFKGRYGDMSDVGTRAISRINSAWKETDNVLTDLNSSWFKSTQYVYGNAMAMNKLEERYDSLALKFTRLKLLGKIIGNSLFGNIVDGEIQYAIKDLEAFEVFGLMPIAQTFAVIRGRVDSFVKGVTDGIGVAIDICKKFFDIVSKPFTAFFDAFDSKLKPIGDAFKSIFGIKGLDGMEMTEAQKQMEMFRQLGEVTGKLMGTLLAFKAIKTITGFITSPFIALGKHIGNATNKLTGFKKSFVGLFGNKDKLRVDKNPVVTNTQVSPKTQEKVAKQKKFQDKYMVHPRGLVGDPFSETAVAPTRSGAKYTTKVVRQDQPTVYSTKTAQTLPKNVVPVTTSPYTHPENYTKKTPVSNVTKTVPTTNSTYKVPVVSTPSFDYRGTGKVPVSNVSKVIDNLEESTKNLSTATQKTSSKKSPMGNVSNVDDHSVNTNTNTNTITRTNTTENVSTRMYDKSQFKKIDGRFFNSKTPLNQRDWGDTTGYTVKSTPQVVGNISNQAGVPVFGQPETKYINVTDREAFENRPAQPTMMPSRITSPKRGARGYSLDHSFLDEQGYTIDDYTNSKTKRLTSSEKEQVELARRKKLTSGKMGGAWNKYFKVKDRVGQFMNEYNDTPKLTNEGKSGKFSRVYSAYTSDRYNDFVAEARGTDKNQTYVKNRSKLGAKLFGHQYYEKDSQTGEMKKAGGYGGRLKADKDDKQTRLAVEKMTANKDTNSTYHYKPTPMDYSYVDADGKTKFNAKGYKEAITKRPNISGQVGTVNDLLDPQGKPIVKLGRNNLENVKGDDTVFKANQGSLRNKLFGERFYTVGTNENGDLYENTVARRGGLMARLSGNGNRMRVKDEGDVSLGGRVNKVVNPIKNTVSKYTPQVVKNAGGAIATGASNLWGSTMMMGRNIASSVSNNKLVKGASSAIGAVKGSKAYQTVSNSKVGKLAGSAVRGVATKEGIKNTTTKTGNFLFGKKTNHEVSYKDSNGQTKTGSRTVRQGGVSGFLLGNKQVDSNTGVVGKRKGGVMGAVKGTAKGVGRVAGGAMRGMGGMAMGALRMAPLAMMGASLGSMAYGSIKEKGGGDFTEGLKVLQEQTKNIDFSGMWKSMVDGAKEIMPIIGSIMKNTFQNLSRDLPNILQGAWEGLKAGASLAWNWIKTDGLALAQSMCGSLGELFNMAWEWVKTDGLAMFTNLCSWIISDGVPLAIEGLMGIGKWLITDALPFVIKAIGDIVVWIATDFAPKMIGEFFTLVGNLASTIWDGITGAFNNVITWAKEKWNGFWDGLFGKKQTVEIDVVENRTVKNSGTTTSPSTTSPASSYTTGNTTTSTGMSYGANAPSTKVHHGGLWMSENEHPAIIRKDETVLPPNKSRKLDEVLNSVSTGSVSTAKGKDTEVREVGDSITIQKVEVVVQAEKLSKSDAKAQAMQVIEEIKKLNKRNNIKNFVY